MIKPFLAVLSKPQSKFGIFFFLYCHWFQTHWILNLCCRYYYFFAFLYKLTGKFADLVMVCNSVLNHAYSSLYSITLDLLKIEVSIVFLRWMSLLVTRSIRVGQKNTFKRCGDSETIKFLSFFLHVTLRIWWHFLFLLVKIFSFQLVSFVLKKIIFFKLKLSIPLLKEIPPNIQR